MQSMVALNIRSRTITTEVLDAITSASNHGADLLVSKVYAEQVQHLFNYGMNACDDQAMVKNSIVELFLLVGRQPEALRDGGSVEIILFKMFRQFLIEQIASRGKRSNPEIRKNLFPAETEMTQGLTSLQREALFLKFQRRLTCREIASVMDLTIEQLRSQVSKAVDILLHKK